MSGTPNQDSSGRFAMDSFVDTEASRRSRALVLVFSIAAFGLVHYWLSPLFSDLLPGLGSLDPGPRTVVKHVFYYTLLDGLVAVLILWLLVDVGHLRSERWDPCRGAGRAVVLGAIAGLGVVLGVVAVWSWKGLGFGVTLNPWSAAGNLASNGYEELAHRGLVLNALLFSTRQPVVAVVLSAALFAWTHASYPVWMQLVVFGAGVVFGAVYLVTGNILAPWVAHCVSDVILDSILIS